MKAVIMAAGQSTRTYPLTLTRPKPLLKVMNRPMLAWQLEALEGVADEAVLVVGYRQDMIREAFGDRFGSMKLTYVTQEEQRGTGHAVSVCRDVVDGPFLALNGDDLYDPADLRRLAATPGSALVKRVPDPRLYGIYDVDAENRVKRLVEKPEEVFSDLANVGAYCFNPDVFDVLESVAPSPRGEIEITSAIQELAAGPRFRVVPMEGYWLPVGYPWHLLEANEWFLNNRLVPGIEGEVSPAAHLSGPVYVGPGSVIRPGVVIDGPVYIGRDCRVGPNCWLRPGATLCDGSHVGHAVEIKNSILMDHAAVPHLSYTGDSVIGERANFGAGTITANLRHDGANVKARVRDSEVDTGRRKMGAIVGDHVHTGINTCLYPGRMLWPETMTYPGECVRKNVTETQRAPQS